MPYTATILFVGSGAPSAGSNGLLDCQVAMAREAAPPEGVLLALVFDSGAQLASTRARASASNTDALSLGINPPDALFLICHLACLPRALTVRQWLRFLSLPVLTNDGQE